MVIEEVVASAMDGKATAVLGGAAGPQHGLSTSPADHRRASRRRSSAGHEWAVGCAQVASVGGGGRAVRELSVPASVHVDDGDTLSDTVFALADEHPDAVAVRRRVDDDWAEVTYEAFVAEIVAVARGLIASGIAP